MIVLHSVPVCIHTAARGTVYRELGAELNIDELLVGPAELFEQLIVDHPAWIRDLIKFVTVAPDNKQIVQ